MLDISLVILSNTTSRAIYDMNVNCIRSFVKSAKLSGVTYEIILVESNFKSTYKYDFSFFKIIKPNKTFNFHEFGNIGLSEATGNHFVFSNNDVIFDVNSLPELISVIRNYKNIKSFSPFDSVSNKLPKEQLQNEFVYGYEIQKHISGWCIIMHHSVFNTINKLDERFNFYYADNDYAMQLQKYNIKHALVTKAKVVHLEAQSSSNTNTGHFTLPKRTPKYIIRENWTWVLENEKMINGLIKFHDKYGSRKIIKLKLMICDYLDMFKLGALKRYVI